MSEIAADMLDPSIIEQAFAAADAYPELPIICPWCRRSYFGSAFHAHAMTHERNNEAELAAIARMMAL